MITPATAQEDRTKPGNGGDAGRAVVANQPPVANYNWSGMWEGSTVFSKVLNNDTDPDGDALSVTSVNAPSGITVTIASDDDLVITAPCGSAGYYEFNYTISDGSASATGLQRLRVWDGDDCDGGGGGGGGGGGNGIDYGPLEPGPGVGNRGPLVTGYNTAGAMDFSEDGQFFVVQQTAGSSPHGTLFHFLGDHSSWSAKLNADPRPSVYQSFLTSNGENVALAPDGSRVYVAAEGKAGSWWGEVYSYDINYHTNSEVSTPQGSKARKEYDAAALTKVQDGLSGMFVSRKNPGIHWFVVDHNNLGPSDGAGENYVLFAIDSSNDKLVWRGSFDIGSGNPISSWGDVEDLTGYEHDGTHYLEIWDNGTDKVYRIAEPTVNVGQSLVSIKKRAVTRVVDLNSAGGVVASGNVEAMAYNPADGKMYWVGPRGDDGDKNNNKREMRSVSNWATLGWGAKPSSTDVGDLINRPEW